MKLAFLIGSCDIGGGTYVIFQHALFAQQQGHDVTLIHLFPKPEHLWHEALRELRFIPFADYKDEPFDLTFATWWPTVYHLSSIHSSSYSYFVQSIESWFCPNEDLRTRRIVEATYTAPLDVITEASWIKKYLEKEYGRHCQLAINGIRKDYLNPDGRVWSPRVAGRLRVLVEGPIGVDFKNVARTIHLAKRAGSDEIWWLTGDDMTWYPGVDRVFSRIPASDVGAVYRSCDVLVKLSYVEGMFGPPLEMFHCGGTAIVYDVTGHEEYIKNGVNALVVPQDDESGVIRAIQRLKKETGLLDALQTEALRTAAAWPDWDMASARFLECADAIRLQGDRAPANIDAALKNQRGAYETPPTRSYCARLKQRILDMIRGRPYYKHLLAPLAYWIANHANWHSPKRNKTRSC